MRKKIVISGIIFIVISGIGLFFWLRKTSNRSSIEKLPPAEIKSELRNDFTVTTTITKDNFNVPSTLAIYELNSTPFTVEEVNQIATNLGFTSSPSSYKGATLGLIYTWYENGNSLQVVPATHVIDYSNKSTPISLTTSSSQFFPKNQLIDLGSKFLTDKKLIPSGMIVDFSDINFFDTSTGEYDETTEDKANEAKLWYKINIGKYPVINSGAYIGTVILDINKDGKIISAHLELPEIKRKIRDYPTKNFEEFKSSLTEAKIQNMGTGDVDLTKLSLDPTLKVSSIDIKDIQIGYLKEDLANQTILQPVFILQGDGILSDNFKTSSELFLPAINNNYLINPSPSTQP